jgi:D-alanyl-D-alanine carboxypeptidase
MRRLDVRSLAIGAPRTLRALRALAFALVLGAGLLAAPATAPPPVAALGPLPACRIGGLPTVPRDYDSWSTTLVDWLLTVGEDYVPPDLVPVSEAGIGGSGYIRQVAIDDLGAMARAAAEAGAPIAVSSPYRSYDDQVGLLNYGSNTYGFKSAIWFWQRPGHSEHQLGLGIDFMSAGGGSPLEGDWATTPAGRWMAENAWRYGWVMSYPKDEQGARPLFSEVTCFHYEPWHYRYLGREIAAKVHDSGLTIREYLWANFTTVDPQTGNPLETPTPSPLATPVPTPTPSRSATSMPTATQSAAPSAGAHPAGTWFGVDPPVLLAGLVVIVLALIGFAAWRGFLRR